MAAGSTDGLYGFVVSMGHMFAWAWIALAVVMVGVIVLTLFRSRHSAWVRRPEDIRHLESLDRLTVAPVALPPRRVA